MQTNKQILAFCLALGLTAPGMARAESIVAADDGGYAGRVIEKVGRGWVPPPGLRGYFSVRIKVTVDENGKVSSCRPVESSELKAFDDAACGAVYNAAPFGKTPDGQPVDVHMAFRIGAPKKPPRELTFEEAAREGAKERERLNNLRMTEEADFSENRARERAEAASKKLGVPLPEPDTRLVDPSGATFSGKTSGKAAAQAAARANGKTADGKRTDKSPELVIKSNLKQLDAALEAQTEATAGATTGNVVQPPSPPPPPSVAEKDLPDTSGIKVESMRPMAQATAGAAAATAPLSIKSGAGSSVAPPVTPPVTAPAGAPTRHIVVSKTVPVPVKRKIGLSADELAIPPLELVETEIELLPASPEPAPAATQQPATSAPDKGVSAQPAQAAVSQPAMPDKPAEKPAESASPAVPKLPAQPIVPEKPARADVPTTAPATAAPAKPAPTKSVPVESTPTKPAPVMTPPVKAKAPEQQTPVQKPEQQPARVELGKLGAAASGPTLPEAPLPGESPSAEAPSVPVLTVTGTPVTDAGAAPVATPGPEKSAAKAAEGSAPAVKKTEKAKENKAADVAQAARQPDKQSPAQGEAKEKSASAPAAQKPEQPAQAEMPPVRRKAEPRPDIGDDPALAGESAYVRYVDRVKREVQRYVKAPAGTPAGTHTVSVQLLLNNKGRIMRSDLIHQSANLALDTKLAEAVKQVGTVTPPPSGLGRSFPITVTIMAP